jgi:hypothetical protein
VNEQKLEALTKPTEPAPTAAQSPTEAERSEELQKANEKLASLLGKQK